MGEFGFEINPITGEFRVVADLEKVLYLINRLRSKLDKQSNISLNNLLAEIKKIYEKIDNTLNPFYRLTNDVVFQKEFGGYYSKFKDTFNKDLNDVEFSCKKVERELNKVVE